MMMPVRHSAGVAGVEAYVHAAGRPQWVLITQQANMETVWQPTGYQVPVCVP